MTDKVLIIGLIEGGQFTWTDELGHQWFVTGNDRSLQAMMHLGAFREGPSRTFLTQKLGIDLSCALNLFPPVRRVIGEIYSNKHVHKMAFTRGALFKPQIAAAGFTRIVTCGSIVYGAFGARGFTFQDALFRIFKRTWNGKKIYHLPLPHPSPRCRIWNSSENILRARAALDKLVTL